MAGQLTNVEHFDGNRADEQTMAQCGVDASLNTTAGVWGVDVNQALIWAQCPLVEPTFTYREPMWLAVWALMAVETGLLILWHLYKTGREFAFHKSMRSAAAVAEAPIDEKIKTDEKSMNAADSETSSLEDSERLRFRGFNIDYFGLFSFGSVVVTTLLFLVFLGCVVSDYCKGFCCF